MIKISIESKKLKISTYGNSQQILAELEAFQKDGKEQLISNLKMLQKLEKENQRNVQKWKREKNN